MASAAPERFSALMTKVTMPVATMPMWASMHKKCNTCQTELLAILFSAMAAVPRRGKTESGSDTSSRSQVELAEVV